MHHNFGPSITGLAWRFSEIFFDNNVCNRKRSTYLKGYLSKSVGQIGLNILVQIRQKLNAVCTLCHILSENKRMILLKTFFEFNYQLNLMLIKSSIGKLIDFIKGRCGLSIRIMYLTFMNSWKKKNLLQYTNAILEH